LGKNISYVYAISKEYSVVWVKKKQLHVASYNNSAIPNNSTGCFSIIKEEKIDKPLLLVFLGVFLILIVFLIYKWIIYSSQ